MSTTYNATRNADGTFTTNGAQPSKLASAAKTTAGVTLVAAGVATYTAVSALATFGFSKLGEKIWDAL